MIGVEEDVAHFLVDCGDYLYNEYVVTQAQQYQD